MISQPHRASSRDVLNFFIYFRSSPLLYVFANLELPPRPSPINIPRAGSSPAGDPATVRAANFSTGVRGTRSIKLNNCRHGAATTRRYFSAISSETASTIFAYEKLRRPKASSGSPSRLSRSDIDPGKIAGSELHRSGSCFLSRARQDSKLNMQMAPAKRGSLLRLASPLRYVHTPLVLYLFLLHSSSSSSSSSFSERFPHLHCVPDFSIRFTERTTENHPSRVRGECSPQQQVRRTHPCPPAPHPAPQGFRKDPEREVPDEAASPLYSDMGPLQIAMLHT